MYRIRVSLTVHSHLARCVSIVVSIGFIPCSASSVAKAYTLYPTPTARWSELWSLAVAVSSLIQYTHNTAMADTPTTTSSEPRTPPSSAAEQARLRKERREAKIRAGGSARLDKITGLGGGIPRGEYLSCTSSPLSQSLQVADLERLAALNQQLRHCNQLYYMVERG
jgi:hypothetical protein